MVPPESRAIRKLSTGSYHQKNRSFRLADHPEVGRPDATAKLRGVSKTRHEHFVANDKEKCTSCFFHHFLQAGANLLEENGRRVAAGNTCD